MNAIETKELTYKYSPGLPDEVLAVDSLSVTVRKGDFVGIIGHTGSGKSTFIQMLAGLLRPTAGQVLIDGQDIFADKKTLHGMRFCVGLVFQYPEYQLFEETVYKDIAFGPKNMGLPDDEIDARVREAARFVGLTDELLDRSPFELSGGQKRRAAIAGVMAMRPEILILDEPAAGLDPRGRLEILDEIEGYHRQSGTTVLLVSHSMEDIARYADRVLVISNGRLFDYGTVEKVFRTAARLEENGLSVPQITELFLELERRGIHFDESVYTVKYAEKLLLAALKGGERP